MNPSDDEVNEGVSQSEEEIESLLEPQAIPDERIVRHAEKNDSYREAPDLEEEIVQSPLKKVSVIETLPVREGVTETETLHTEDIPEVALSNLEEVAPLPRMSQHDIDPEVIPQEEVVIEQTVLDPEIMPQTINEEPVVQMVTENEVASQSVSESVPTSQIQPVVYHTISGGPETLNDVASQHKKVEQPVEQSNQSGSQTPNYANAPSGYVIPDPKYMPSTVPVANSQTSFGIVIFLGSVLIIGVAVGGVYFLLPETFNQILLSIIVIKDQLLKK